MAKIAHQHKLLHNLMSPTLNYYKKIRVKNITNLKHHILKYNYVGDRLTCHQHAEKCHQRP